MGSGDSVLQDAKTNRRTGFWLHQRGARISPVQLPRVRECGQRVETDLCHAQSVEAFPVRLEKAAFEKLTVPKTRSRGTPQKRNKDCQRSNIAHQAIYSNNLNTFFDKPMPWTSARTSLRQAPRSGGRVSMIRAIGSFIVLVASLCVAQT